MKAKILAFDVETAPSIGYHWGRFDQRIPQAMIIQEGSLLCWCARWVDDSDNMYHDSVWNYGNDMRNDLEVAQTLADMIEEADFVVAHNAKFDTGWLTRSLIKNDLPPPRMPRVIDTLKIARSSFKMPSNRLGDLAHFLGLTAKEDPGGFQTWRDILEAKGAVQKRAQERMLHYCMTDVDVLVEVYERIKPYWKSHPNLGAFSESPVCNTCQSLHVVSNGYYRSNSGKYARYKCTSCGNQSIRGKQNLINIETRKSQLVGVT